MRNQLTPYNKTKSPRNSLFCSCILKFLFVLVFEYYRIWIYLNISPLFFYQYTLNSLDACFLFAQKGGEISLKRPYLWNPRNFTHVLRLCHFSH